MTTDDETDVTPAEADDIVADSDETESEAIEADTDSEDTDSEDTDSDEVEPAPRRGTLRRLLIPLSLVVLLLASAGLATWTYLSMYRPDQQTNDEVAARVVQAATDGTVALLSYAPETLDKDFANAKGRLTGDFLNYYSNFTETIVTPAAKQKSVKTAAAVVRSAVSRLEPKNAEVLLFVNQTTTSKENPDGAYAASSVKVGLTKIGNDWLISSFDPV